MKLTPNLNRTWRIAYVILGIGLIAGPFIVGAAGWQRIVFPILGAMAAFTGATGW